MNNGNVLNNLLGISSATSAAAKASSAKARSETSEKFQQALEQARPEVAARKPVARKESAANEAPAARPVSKPTVRQNSQAETHRADLRPKAPLDESTAARKSTDTPESPTPKVDANPPVEADQKDTQSLEAQVQTQVQTQVQFHDQIQDLTHAQTQGEQAEILVPTEDILLIDPALVITDQSSELLGTPEDLLNPDTNLLELDDSDIDPLLTLDVPLDPSLVVPEASLSPLAALASVESTDTLASDLPPLTAASQATLSQVAVASGVAVNGSQSSATQSLVAPTSLADDLSDKLTLDAKTEEIEGANAEAELSADAESGDNPDFQLLNSKAALNKLTEATMTAPALDKAAPAADVAKPAALAAAVESLTRLTEAQSPAARAFVVQTGVPVPVGTPQWSQAVGDKVLWLAAQNVSAAEIRLDPPELGPMQVKVSIHQDQASISFSSPHPIVREALDQQLHRLREMFSEQGLNLVNVDVSDKSFAQQEREQKESTKNQANVDLEEDDLVPVGISQNLSMRLVDHYA